MLKYLIEKIKVLQHQTVGATAIEYGLIAGLIAVVIISGIGLTGGSVEDMYDDIGATVTAVMGG